MIQTNKNSQALSLFDRAQIARNLGARAKSGGKSRPNNHPDFVTQLVVDDLKDRLLTLSRAFSKALILAPDIAGLPTNITTPAGTTKFTHRPTLLGHADAPAIDLRDLSALDHDHDLVISLFDLAITDDVPAYLAQLRTMLKPDGLLMAAFIGGVSLNELRAAWLEADAKHLDGAAMRVAPFIDTSDAAALLQRTGLALPVADVETHKIRYKNPLALMRELKQLGASNPLKVRSPQPVTKSHLISASTAYENSAQDRDGRVRATLEIIWMSGWVPHESQQKPLKRGSATVSLKDVLEKKR